MKRLFDILSKKNLTTNTKIENTIMSRWKLSDVVNLYVELLYVIESIHPPNPVIDTSNYTFLPNSNMTAQPDSGCLSWDCRLERIDQLARFAILYADRIYIPSYFRDIEHLTEQLQDDYDEYMFRYNLAGNLKILLKLKPLILSGIFNIVPNTSVLCATCWREINKSVKTVDTRLNKQVLALEKLYLTTTTAELRFHSSVSNISGHTYDIYVDCDEELFEHGSFVSVGTRLPSSLRKKIEAKKSTIPLTKTDIKRSHIIRKLLDSMADDVTFLKLHQSRYNLKYLTNNSIDISLMEATIDNSEYQNYNDMLSSQLAFNMPFFPDIPYKTLLNIRKNEFQSFLDYRTTIKEITDNYVLQNKELSQIDAIQIYTDLVKPKLISLDNKLKSIRSSYIKRATSSFAIASGVLTFGFCATFLPTGLESALLSLGLVEAVDTIKSIFSSVRTPGEIRNDNLYFLWKLSKANQNT